jgi:predicted enzyme related to lactoylglutathione lyase
MINNHISYIEFKAKDIEATKAFYTAVFGWYFKDYGPDYTSFSGSGVSGGFEKSDGDIIQGVLIVLYHDNLKFVKEQVLEYGGKITREIFMFPGGKRFHFQDPSGNELAVWSE